MASLLGLGNESLQSLRMGWHTFPAKRRGETCMRGSNRNKSPGLGETHVLCLEEILIFFLVLCICQVELELHRGMDRQVHGHTAVLQATDSKRQRW